MKKFIHFYNRTLQQIITAYINIREKYRHKYNVNFIKTIHCGMYNGYFIMER